MAKEILVVPEDILEEVIHIIHKGLFHFIPQDKKEQRAWDLLNRWIDEEAEYIQKLNIKEPE